MESNDLLTQIVKKPSDFLTLKGLILYSLLEAKKFESMSALYKYINKYRKINHQRVMAVVNELAKNYDFIYFTKNGRCLMLEYKIGDKNELPNENTV